MAKLDAPRQILPIVALRNGNIFLKFIQFKMKQKDQRGINWSFIGLDQYCHTVQYTENWLGTDWCKCAITLKVTCRQIVLNSLVTKNIQSAHMKLWLPQIWLESLPNMNRLVQSDITSALVRQLTNLLSHYKIFKFNIICINMLMSTLKYVEK